MRKFLLLLSAAALALSGCGQKKAGPATLFQWEDYVQAPVLADYVKATGEKPNTVIFADEDEAFAKMKAGFKPDVMGSCSYEFPRWRAAGLLQPIDPSRLKNWNKLSPTLRALPGIDAGGGKVWFVPHYWGDTSVTIRTDLAPEYARSQSWQILFDPKYKGRIAVLDGVDDTVPIVARLAGVDAYTMDEAGWQKVQAKLRQLMPQLRFISSDATTLAQGLASGELVAAMSWRNTFASLNREGRNVSYLQPPGGMFTYVCGLVMHKDPSDEAKALALIDSTIGEEASRYAIEEVSDGPANLEVLAKVPDKVFQTLHLGRDVETFLKGGTFQRPLPNKEKIVQAWTELRAGIAAK